MPTKLLKQLANVFWFTNHNEVPQQNDLALATGRNPVFVGIKLAEEVLEVRGELMGLLDVLVGGGEPTDEETEAFWSEILDVLGCVCLLTTQPELVIHKVIACMFSDIRITRGFLIWVPFKPSYLDNWKKKQVARARVFGVYQNDFQYSLAQVKDYLRDAWRNNESIRWGLSTAKNAGKDQEA